MSDCTLYTPPVATTDRKTDGGLRLLSLLWLSMWPGLAKVVQAITRWKKEERTLTFWRKYKL